MKDIKDNAKFEAFLRSKKIFTPAHCRETIPKRESKPKTMYISAIMRDSSEIINIIKTKQTILENELVEMFVVSKNMLTRMLLPYIKEHKIWFHIEKRDGVQTKYYHDYITPNIIISPPKKTKAEYQKEYQRKYRIIKGNNPKYTQEFLLNLINTRCILTLNDFSRILNEKKKVNIVRWMKPLIKSGQVYRSSDRMEYYKVLTDLEIAIVDFIGSLTKKEKEKVSNVKSKEELFSIFEK